MDEIGPLCYFLDACCSGSRACLDRPVRGSGNREERSSATRGRQACLGPRSIWKRSAYFKGG